MSDIVNSVKKSRNQEVDTLIANYLEELESEGLTVEFGQIGRRTNYALIHDESYDVEIVGYTFLKDIKYYKENVGKLKALQQAIARKNLSAESK